jgi:3-deoxy-D-manno-octulosonic-acid transferase
VSNLLTIPNNVTLPLSIYRAVIPFVAAALLPGFFLRMRRRGGYRENFAQRLGWFSATDQETLSVGGWTWIHSISVGETLVALKLAHSLRFLEPDIRIVLSTTTSTGFAIAKDASKDWLVPIYNPVDSRGAVRRTLELLAPRQVVLIEGDVWPNLLTKCVELGIPIALANARLSPRSAARFHRFRRWVCPLFSLLDWIGVPDAEAADKWTQIGIPRSKLHITGNIKFDQLTTSENSRTSELRHLLSNVGIPPEMPLLIAGSTHEGEELILAKLLPQWRSRHRNLRLILVPRHIERVAGLIMELKPLGFQIVRRSQIGASTEAASADILIVDTTGELRDWYALGTVIFVGKSLTGIGGQNPVEPALTGKPVIFGPHMENFQTVVEQLLRSDGALQVADEIALLNAVDDLLGNAGRCSRVAQNAAKAVKDHQGATRKTAELLLQKAELSPTAL